MLHGSTGDRLYMSLSADYIESTSVMAHQLYSKNVQTCGPILTLPSPVFYPNAILHLFDASAPKTAQERYPNVSTWLQEK